MRPDMGPNPAEGPLIILLPLLSRARLEAATAPRPLPELETYSSPCPFSHSKEVGVKEVALLLP